MEKNIMKCLCIVVMVALQISRAMSQSRMSPPGQNLIQQLCSHNTYPKLCLSSLQSNPRGLTSNLEGLAAISMDVTSKKVKETLQYMIDAFKKVVGRGDYERYGTCVEEYGAAVDRILPEAFSNLKAKKYEAAISNMRDVSMKPLNCDGQFIGKSPFADRGSAVHDLSLMTSDVIKVLSRSN